MEKKILKRVKLSTWHEPTGKTRHFRGIEELPTPTSLEIVEYPETGDYYLLYLNQDGAQQTDTWHASLDSALAQAEFEFGITRDEWASAE